jgi:hypothetical protein
VPSTPPRRADEHHALHAEVDDALRSQMVAPTAASVSGIAKRSVVKTMLKEKMYCRLSFRLPPLRLTNWLTISGVATKG